MRNPNGYAQIIDPNAPLVEYDTASCCHCSAIIFVVPGTACTEYLLFNTDGSTTKEPGASCFRCMKPICLGCYEIGTCTPLERQLEELEGKIAKGRIIY